MLEKPFTLSVKIVIHDDEDRWLVLKRAMHSMWNPGKWELPGGKFKPGESFHDTLLREIFEETGLKSTIQGVMGVIEDESKDYRLAHLIMVGKAEPGSVILSSEHNEYKWAPFNKLRELQLCKYMQDLIELKENQKK